MNKAANDSARVSGQDRKKLPALGTNQMAGFGGFRPLASLEKTKKGYHDRQCQMPLLNQKQPQH